jgi:hypothetical protein
MHVNMSETSVIEMSSVFEMSQEMILSLSILELFRLLNSSTQITIVSASTESKSIASVLLESKSTIVFDNKEKNMLFIFLICLTIQYLLRITKTSSSILKLYYAMNKDGLISSISAGRSTKDMQVLDEQSKAYFDFINWLKSESTKKSYKLCLEKFLNQLEIDLPSLLKLPQDELTNLIIKYLVEKKISKQYKNLITATLKHACEINDIVLNWRKIKKFINFEKTGNETNGKDRGYTDKEIQKILEFGDQRLKTAFLVLASTGIRVGALQSIRIHDLERIDNLYKVVVYSESKRSFYKSLSNVTQSIRSISIT